MSQCISKFGSARRAERERQNCDLNVRFVLCQCSSWCSPVSEGVETEDRRQLTIMVLKSRRKASIQGHKLPLRVLKALDKTQQVVYYLDF